MGSAGAFIYVGFYRILHQGHRNSRVKTGMATDWIGPDQVDVHIKSKPIAWFQLDYIQKV
jgi:hypothetical protein